MFTKNLRKYECTAKNADKPKFLPNFRNDGYRNRPLLTNQHGVGCHHWAPVALRLDDHEVCHRVLRLEHLYEGGDSYERSGSRVFHFRAKWCNRVSSPHRNLACYHGSEMPSRFLSRVLNLQCLPRIGGGISLHCRVLFWQRLPQGWC